MGSTLRDIAVAHARAGARRTSGAARARALSEISRAARASDPRISKHHLLCAWKCVPPARTSFVGADEGWTLLPQVATMSPSQVVRMATMITDGYARLSAGVASCPEAVRARVESSRASWMQDVAPDLVQGGWATLVPNAQAILSQEAGKLVDLGREADACRGARSNLFASLLSDLQRAMAAGTAAAASGAVVLGIAAAIALLVFSKGRS